MEVAEGWKTLKSIFPKMKKESIFIIGFEGDYMGRDITNRLSEEEISGKVIGSYGYRIFVQRV